MTTFLHPAKRLPWASHSLYLWRLRQARVSYLRGHRKVLLSWFFVLVSVMISFSTTIRQLQHSHNDWYKADSLLPFVTTTLHLLYMLTLFPSPSHTRHHYEVFSASQSYPSINDDAGERESLIGHSLTSKRYSTIPSDDTDDIIHLGVAEGTNIFSKLVFWWVEPLMKKGAKGQLRKVEDLFHLPTSMASENVEREFNKIYLHPETQINSANETDELNSFKTSIETSVKPCPKTLTLLQALKKAFGPRYYALGLVNFMSNMLSFAGPLMLNALVSFVESGDEEPMIYGYYYALGLVLSTLIVAVSNTHIHYQIHRLRIQMRGALTTTIYRKSLAASLTNISTFSTGEIINFMSTDCPRVVNVLWVFHGFLDFSNQNWNILVLAVPANRNSFLGWSCCCYSFDSCQQMVSFED